MRQPTKLKDKVIVHCLDNTKHIYCCTESCIQNSLDEVFEWLNREIPERVSIHWQVRGIIHKTLREAKEFLDVKNDK